MSSIDICANLCFPARLLASVTALFLGYTSYIREAHKVIGDEAPLEEIYRASFVIAHAQGTFVSRALDFA